MKCSDKFVILGVIVDPIESIFKLHSLKQARGKVNRSTKVYFPIIIRRRGDKIHIFYEVLSSILPLVFYILCAFHRLVS